MRDDTGAGRIRLARHLAMAGVASRRKSEDLIAAGVVAVNGSVVTKQGTTVDPARDRVTVRGQELRPRAAGTERRPLVVALHKPRGVLTARGEARGARTVYDMVEEPPGGRLVYVGRLDRDTEGLLLLTTDGALAHRLTHPRWEVERVYEAWVAGPVDTGALQRAARNGIVLDDGERTAPFEARVVSGGRKGVTKIELILREGKKREVRRIVAALGGRVERLVRTRYGTVSLEGLAPGKTRRLRAEETARLRALVGITGKREE